MENLDFALLHQATILIWIVSLMLQDNASISLLPNAWGEGARRADEGLLVRSPLSIPLIAIAVTYQLPWFCRSLISDKVLQSMHKVAVGRASRRRKPISIPQASQ